ncbi:MAG: Asp-tRNA(Asn)/Glu-tRNA(Gln) amidotransferase GatCAB subunit B, partial [Selenomonadaceae bacterium]
ANWMMGDLAKNLNAEGKTIEYSPIEAKRLGDMINLITKGTISSKIAKDVFAEMWKSKDAPEKIVKDKGLVQITDTNELDSVLDEVITANPKPVADFKSGNKKAIGALVGQVMKKTHGKANPKLVNEMLQKKLS